MGFKVIALTGDGASSNKKFFRLHCSNGEADEVCYKTANPYTDENRNIYFISDVPHLIKTIWNCWSHSFVHGCYRKLWVNIYIACNVNIINYSCATCRLTANTSVGNICVHYIKLSCLKERDQMVLIYSGS